MDGAEAQKIQPDAGGGQNAPTQPAYRLAGAQNAKDDGRGQQQKNAPQISAQHGENQSGIILCHATGPGEDGLQIHEILVGIGEKKLR